MSTTLDNDRLHHFIFDDTDIRGEIVTLSTSLQQIFIHQHYPSTIQHLLGEFMAAVALLSKTLKFEGLITLQARGDGPLPLVMAEINHKRQLRGVAKVHGTTSSLKGNLPSLIGEGVLSITIDPDKGNRYQGIVPLDAPNLADCLEHYFLQSEQLPTRLWLACDGATASGMLLQQLPQKIASKAHNAEAWENRVQLANTLTGDELLHLDHTQLLTRLFHEQGVRCFEPHELSFGCHCSKQRSGLALKHLGQAKAELLVLEQGIISIDCEFCGSQYTYDKKDVADLFAPKNQH